jgi:site-specific DNA-methyltransferase (adenine-specific)
MNLILGDCLEKMKEIPDESVDMVLADPPYGSTSCKWDIVIPFEPLWKELNRVTKVKSSVLMMGSQPFSSLLVCSNIKNFKHEWIWKKSRSGSALTARYAPVKRHEGIFVFSKGKMQYNPIMEEGKPYSRMGYKLKTNNHNIGLKEINVNNFGTRFPISVLDIKQNWSKQQQIHPTQKPVELMEYLIKTYSNEGDTVLDFVFGSGTVGVACKNLKRNFIGIEKDENYFNIAKNRIESVSEG